MKGKVTINIDQFQVLVCYRLTTLTQGYEVRLEQAQAEGGRYGVSFDYGVHEYGWRARYT